MRSIVVAPQSPGAASGGLASAARAAPGLARNSKPMRKLIGLSVFLLLTACGDIPQPFRHDLPNPALAPSAARGVVVRPPDDSPQAGQVADAIIRRLMDAESPASRKEVVAGAWVLGSEVVAAPGLTVLRWTLTRPPSGEVLGGLEQRIPAATWVRGSSKTIELVAAEVVDKLMGPLHGDGAGGSAAAEPVEPSIRLLPLSGLPGDGDRSLAKAMGSALKQVGLRPVEGEADFLLRASVTVAPGRPGEDVLAVTWSVTTAKGGEIGNSAQQGPVAKGQLAGPWGSLAADIALGGAEGVAEIVRNAAGPKPAERGLVIPGGR